MSTTRRVFFSSATATLAAAKAGEVVPVDQKAMDAIRRGELVPGSLRPLKRLLIIVDPHAFSLEGLDKWPVFGDDIDAIILPSWHTDTDIKIFNLDAIPEETVDGILKELKALSSANSVRTLIDDHALAVERLRQIVAMVFPDPTDHRHPSETVRSHMSAVLRSLEVVKNALDT